MCLLIKHSAETAFDRADIEDFYSHNKDGFGVMWADLNDANVPTLFTFKIVGTVEEVWEAYQKYAANRECAVHFRMKTHGAIDQTNTHPYTVLTADAGYPVAMMHNGVLSTGNSADTSKSDTWHYVQDYMRPMLENNHAFHQHPAFAAVIGAHITSSNRFITLDAYGHTNVINFPNLKYKGSLMSNTYAWSAEKGGYGYTSYGSGFRNYSGYSSYGKAYWDDEEETQGKEKTPAGSAVSLIEDDDDDLGYEPADLWMDSFFEALDTVDGDLYRLTSYTDAESLYEYLGATDAWHLVDEIDAGMVGAIEIRNMIRAASTKEVA